MESGSNGVAMLAEILLSVVKTMKTPEEPMFSPEEQLAASANLAVGVLMSRTEDRGEGLRDLVDLFERDLRDLVAGQGVDDAFHGADRP